MRHKRLVLKGLNTAMTNGSKQAIIAEKRDKFGWFALTKWVDFINNVGGLAQCRHGRQDPAPLEQNHP